jgi:hypothetical protein
MRKPGTQRSSTVMAVAVLLAAALLTLVTGAAPAAAAACGSAHKKGVTVVVDFRHFGGHATVRCDAKRPSTGLAALRNAKFSYTFVPRHPGFICRIGKKPTKCNGAPTSAYWSYWHAKPHGKWVYSTVGAASYHPKAGWVEGWAFGNGKPPGISPP